MKIFNNLAAAKKIFACTKRFKPLRKVNPKSNSGIALIEMNLDFSSHAAYALLMKTISKHSVRYIGYSHVPVTSFGSQVKWHLATCIPKFFAAQRPNYLYSRIGVKQFLKPKLELKTINMVFDSKKALLGLRVSGILIGDLFYDFHLAKRKLGTVNLFSKDFEQDLEEFIALTNFWIEYFSSHKVKFVVTSHSVYTQGLTGRVGISFGARVFVVNHERLYQLSSRNLLSDCESKFYSPDVVSQFGHLVDLKRGTLQLEKVVNGKPEPSSHHGLVSGFMGNEEVTIGENERINILIAAHCFSDSPNALGPQLFPDFLEWLEFLGQISREIEANWYIKEHPAFNTRDFEIFREFLSRHPQLKPIPRTVSNQLLFKQRLDLVLTVHGTIAVEAAWNGIKVINASVNSPHANYDFSLTPTTIDEYRQLLQSAVPNGLRNLPEPKIEDLAHFFDLHHNRRSRYWLYGESTPKFVRQNMDYKSRVQSLASFTFWYENFENSTNLLEIELEKFIFSDEYLF